MDESKKHTPSDTELVEEYCRVLEQMKARGIIHSNNVTGDLAEYLAIKLYRQTPGLPKLQSAPPSTKNVDALSSQGDRYSIKGTTGHVTGVFYGLNPPESQEVDQQRFEYVVVVMLDETYKLKRINELTWQQFLIYKKWHSRMNAWNLPVTKELLDNTRTIFLAKF
jgi:hypothetical protein